MIRKKNKFQRPKKAFESSRIKEENALLEKYGLKSKIEVWKTLAKVSYFRKRAMALAKLPLNEQKILFDKLKALSLKADSIADILALKIEDLLERRLPTIVYKKGIAKTTKEARQMVFHKRIFIDNKVVDSPSYLVSTDEENKIELKKKIKKIQIKENKPAEVTEGKLKPKETAGVLGKVTETITAEVKK